MEYKRSTSSMTPDQSGKVGVGMVANPVPFLTPRPERRRPDSRGVDWGSSKAEKDRGEVNIQVFEFMCVFGFCMSELKLGFVLVLLILPTADRD
ncbi:hypothetical protein HanOQP8_Chr01g0033131 [Helianthus annuus]|nr:hypothetical protein HanOQP8_Chr01g0033131 [Helianthus annuus]